MPRKKKLKVGERYHIIHPENMGMPRNFKGTIRVITEVSTKDGAGIFGGWGIEVSDVECGNVKKVNLEVV